MFKIKNNKIILLNIGEKRFLRNQLSKKKKKLRRILKSNSIRISNYNSPKYLSKEELLVKYLPPNIKYLIFHSHSGFNINNLKTIRLTGNGRYLVPKTFSILENPTESYDFIFKITATLIFQKFNRVIIDYVNCIELDLSTQVLLDIILIDIIKYYNKIRVIDSRYSSVKEIGGDGYNSEDIQKLLFSVGSPAIHANRSKDFVDVVPYKLCIHEKGSSKDILKSERKDIDTTTLVDYVLNCLNRINKKLTPEKLDDLCIVISEILINAEEHSSTNFRFSIGYFNEVIENGKHFGVFRLSILNFGQTIYEKFKTPNFPNHEIATKMKELSDCYTSKNFFNKNQFEEETLWTLYSLQEGVTSIPTDKYKKRGNGSIRFIESFFNFKGDKKDLDVISRMDILSGNANIVFDGTYQIHEKAVDNEFFKFMTFNKSQEIEDKPDSNYVKFVNNFFPGTIISAKILFNDDDFAK